MTPRPVLDQKLSDLAKWIFNEHVYNDQRSHNSIRNGRQWAIFWPGACCGLFRLELIGSESDQNQWRRPFDSSQSLLLLLYSDFNEFSTHRQEWPPGSSWALFLASCQGRLIIYFPSFLLLLLFHLLLPLLFSTQYPTLPRLHLRSHIGSTHNSSNQTPISDGEPKDNPQS
jgi:hypothetical protein